MAENEEFILLIQKSFHFKTQKLKLLFSLDTKVFWDKDCFRACKFYFKFLRTSRSKSYFFLYVIIFSTDESKKTLAKNLTRVKMMIFDTYQKDLFVLKLKN